MAGIQNSIANAISGSTVGGGAGPEPPTGDDLLDLYPGATGAYSVRLLRAEYAGAALRVRREDTNEETDIGFDVSGNLDTAALIDFCSFTNGLVSVWYDQSGLGVNLVQDAETSQPKIYDVADGVIMDGGRPAMLLDGDDDNIKADITDVSAPVTGFFMRSYQTIGGTYIGLGMGGAASSWFDINSIGVFQSYFGTFSLTFPADTEQGLYTAIVDGGSSVVSYNGNEKTTTLSGSLVENICVGSTFGGAFYANIKAQELIFYPSNESGSKGDIEENMAGYFTDVVPLLDTYGGAAAAYSLRRLSSTYSGAPVAVRNGGGVVADIGFDVFGRLDIVELKEHCGSTNGTVATWYDQSGLGNDATQSDPLNQPKVFDGATGLVTENGKPALDFAAISHFDLVNYINPTANTTYTLSGVARPDVNDNLMVNLTDGTELMSWAYGRTAGNLTARTFDGATVSDTSGAIAINTQFVGFSIHDFTSVSTSLYINGGAATGTNAGRGDISQSTIGDGPLSSLQFDGAWQEIVLWGSDQSPNRELIEDNIDKYYGITSEGVLDKYPGAAAAYSLRRLTRAYRGPLITARRTDGQLKDIYATSTGELDVVTLSAWSSGQDATVQVWFDQSGEGDHATQTTPTSQPKIYDAATGVVTNNGKPSLEFAAGNFINNTTWDGAATTYVFNVLQSNGLETTPRIAVDVGSFVEYYGLGVDGNTGASSAGIGSVSHYSNGVAIGTTRDIMWDAMQVQNVLTVSGDFSSWTGGFGLSRSGQQMYTYAQEFVIYNSDQSSRRVGIEDDLAEYYNLKEYRLLDRYPGAAAAYSLRLLSTSYLSDPEPYAVRVRRSSDNEEADIGFDGFGNLNVSLLEDFCAGADGFVSRWFDQSGGGNDANQNDEGAQPQLVASGAVIVENGEPAIQTDGSDDTMSLTSTINFTDLTWLTVTKKADTASNGSVIFFGGGTNAYAGDDVDNRGNPFLQAPGASIIRNTLGNTSASGGEVNQHLAYYNRNGTNASGGLNGEVNTEATVATTAFGLTELFQYGSNYNYEGLVQELVLYNSSKKSDRTGIETNIDRHYKIGTLLLDKYPSAAAAYSLRLLSSSYEGPLIEVQRSGDGKTIDIYPDPFGVLDTATLSAFCNGLTGTVRTWYDQSGGGNDATQTDPLAQPTIFTGGAVVTDNGKPAVEFDGSDDILINTTAQNSFEGAAQAFTMLHVAQTDNTSNFQYAFSLLDGANATLRDNDQIGILAANDNTFAAFIRDYSAGTAILPKSVGTVGTSQNLGTAINTGSILSVYANGTTGNSESTNYSALAFDYASVGGRYGGSTPSSDSLWDGKIQEILAYASDQSPNREGIESNINDFYEMYTPFTTGLLDDYPTAAAAYSLRALSSTYYNGATPYAIEVRRASDGATQDIGFDIEGNLDVAALSSFCSGTDGTVQTWYDQSGSGNNATQPDPLVQPKIYDSATGVVTLDSGKPAISMNPQTTLPTPATLQSPYTLLAVMNRGGNTFTLFSNPPFTLPMYTFSGEYRIYDGANLYSVTPASSISGDYLRLDVFDYNTPEGQIRLNSVSHSITPLQNYTAPNVSITRTSSEGGEVTSEIIWYNSNQGASNITSIETNINDHYEIYETGLLAEYPGAAAAYSVRQLRSFYDGPAIRVRRDSDDAELDIGFDENGDLDLVALGDFCKYTDGFVKVWYDQANSNDATQTTTGSQPKIYDSVAGVITENGKPAIESNGTTTKLSNFTVSLTGNYLITLVSKLNSAGSNMWLGTTANSGYWRAVDTGTSVTIRHNGETGGADFNVSVGTTQLLHTAQRVSTTMHYAQNGSDNTTAERATQGVTFDVSCLFDGYANQYEIDGTMQEVIIYASNQSTNRTGIESNINTYYSIY